MVKPDAVIAHTQNWLKRLVIDYGLCPFAKREFDAGSIDYVVAETQELQEQLGYVLSAFEALDVKGAFETSLLIFPRGLADFSDYLELLDIAQALLKDQGYEGVYQLASFHPRYQFEGAAPDDASHFTNRSPYPMLHILREASVEAALKSYPNPEAIPQRNVKLMKKLGVAALQGLLNACRE